MASISVIGAGYVGLTAAVCLAELGHAIRCADLDSDRVEQLRSGNAPMHEDRLEELLRSGLASGRLSFTSSSLEAVSQSEFHFLCLPTPQGADGQADLSAVEAAMNQLKDALPAGSVVVTKSTVPIGTADRLTELIDRSDVAVVSCPEFLREGTAIRDFLEPDRIVIGAPDELTAKRVATIFDPLNAPILSVDQRSAEAIKYASNAFLATKLSFINDMATLCEAVGAEIEHVTAGIAADPRIGGNFLTPGPGWGGSCFPKDVNALISQGEAFGIDLALLTAVNDSNTRQIQHTVQRILDAVAASPDPESAVVAAWGLTFKAGTSDRRDSPAIEVLQQVIAAGHTVQAFDPTVNGPIDELTQAHIASDPYSATTDADVLVVLTEWSDFTTVDLDKVASCMRTPAVFDTRGILDADLVRAAGISFQRVGR